MIRLLLSGAALGGLALAATAGAQPAPPPPPGVAQGTGPVPMASPSPRAPEVHMMFGGDHVMTRGEVAEHVAKLFARLDTNHDGFITKDEVAALHAKMMAGMERAGDVQERLAEHGVMMGDRGAMFDRMDTNHDGVISRDEFMAARPEVRTERVMIMRGPGGAPGTPPMPPMEGNKMEFHFKEHGGMHAGMGMGDFAGRLFDMADTNHDGRVSLAEAQAAALAHFDKADLNHDGKITPDERRQMHEMMRMEHHPG